MEVNTVQTKKSEIHSTISTLSKNFEIAFARGNTADIADFYSEYGVLLPAASDFVQGKDNIKEFWQTAIDMGIKNIQLEILEVEQHDDTAIEMSKFTLSDTDDQMIDQGKGIVIWKKENNVWKMHRDIWNSSLVQQ